MSHNIVAPYAKSRSRLLGRALVEAGLVLSLTLAIIAVICSLGIDRAAAAGLDGMALDGDRATMGAVLLALFAGLCVLTTFMLRNTLPAERTSEVRRRGRQG